MRACAAHASHLLCVVCCAGGRAHVRSVPGCHFLPPCVDEGPQAVRLEDGSDHPQPDLVPVEPRHVCVVRILHRPPVLCARLHCH